MPAKEAKAARRPKGAATVDEYLAQVEEVIPPSDSHVRLHGPLVHFAAQPRHLAFIVVSLDVIREVRDELEGFDVSGRTIRFSPDNPLPAALVKRIVQARVRENEARARA